MKLIIGLGNPGIKYEKTRHNFGWQVIDRLGEKLEINNWKEEKQFKSKIALGNLNEEKIILVKPQTFMNDSGSAVQSIAHYYKVPPEKIMIIHDEIDLPLGEVKIQEDRGAAGHNGVQSVIDQLGAKNFVRTRLGIGITEQTVPTERFVLQSFTEEEEKIVEETIEEATQLIIAKLEKK